MEHKLFATILNAHGTISPLVYIRLGMGFPKSVSAIIFEYHWAIWAAMLLLAIAAIWRGINTRQALVRTIGGVILAVTMIWILTATLVVTPHERLVNANDAIISAAAHDDVPAVMRYISHRAIFGQWKYARIQSGLANRLKAIHITGNIIRSMTVHMQASQAVTHMVIWTSTRDYGPVITSWRFVWQDHPRPGNWRIREVDLLAINGRRTRPDAVIPLPR